MLWRQSKQHLTDVQEGYFKHLWHALGYATKLLGAGFALLVHAIVPGWFQTTGSRTVFTLNAILQARLSASRQRHGI